VAEAHRRLEEGGLQGKLVVCPDLSSRRDRVSPQCEPGPTSGPFRPLDHAVGASKAAAFVALAPVMAALMAIPALGERPTSTDWLAIGMITAGVYLASGAPVPGQTAKILHATGRGLSRARCRNVRGVEQAWEK
jgi:EamA-like transporter family